MKVGRYKAKYCYWDGKFGYSIEGLLAEYLSTHITHEPMNNIANFIRINIPQIVLSRDLEHSIVNNRTAMDIRAIPKHRIIYEFFINIFVNNGRTSIRELAILNDQTEMTFDDFQYVFERNGI